MVKRGLTSLLAEGLTLDLAVYECLNVVWREYRLLKRIDEGTASSLVKVMNDALAFTEIRSIKGLEGEVFSLACREGLTV